MTDVSQVDLRFQDTTRKSYKAENNRHKFTLEQYDSLIKIGFLGEDERLELLNGEILRMSPIGPSHVNSVNRLNRQFNRHVDDSIIVSIQNPIALPPNSEPEPDVALIREQENSAAHMLAGPTDVLLLVEVADSSLGYDREVKIPHYAISGIPEVWLVNLAEECVEVYSGPNPNGYQSIQFYWTGQIVQSATMADLEMSVDLILGTN